MTNRVTLCLATLISVLPAFAQGREDLVSAPDTVRQTKTAATLDSILAPLDFINAAYEDNSLLETLSTIANPPIATESGVLSMIIDAYTDSIDLFQHRITSPFGFREEFGKMHWGIDLAMNAGSNVTVPLDGTVARIGHDPDGYGLYIIVTHPSGLETRYAHLRDVLVRPGQTVTAGSVIATAGNSGNTTAAHLHFEVRRSGLPLNPTTVFPFPKSR